MLEYIDDTEENLNEAISTIGLNSAVLFLGPMFGLDKEGCKINAALWNHFDKIGPKLDEEFQNLFIKTQEFDRTRMTTRIKVFYDKVEPNTIYADIAKLKFSAIFCFTQDMFMANSFGDKGKCDFRYYSSKGVGDPEFSKKKDRPIVYNFYGSYNDPNSLITDYDSFYKFLFSILGDSSFFPKDLATIISDSNVLMFLGFDLKKWYVPLLVTKILNIGNTTMRDRFTIASLNDTEHDNPEYLKWLGRYPLKLKFITDSCTFINKMLESPECLRPPGPPAGENRLISRELAIEWNKQIASAPSAPELCDVYDSIIDFGNQKSLPEIIAFFNTSKSDLVAAIKNVHRRIISDDELSSIKSKIVYDSTEFLTTV